MNHPKISVCLPFYNVEPYVSRCLDSVLNNTYQNLEAICVNDGSTDGTSALLHEYAKKDSRIRVIDKENGGLVSARQAAMELATGAFLSFIDGDDWVHPQFFEILLTVQEKTGADIVICNYTICSEFLASSEIEADQVTYQISDPSLVIKDWNARIRVCGRIYSRELLPKISVPSYINMGEDTVFNLLFLCSRPDIRMARIPQGLYYYFQREDSITHTISHSEKIDVPAFFAEHYAEIKDNDSYGIVLHDMLKFLLSYRYKQLFSGNRRFVRKTCREVYHFCRANWNPSFSQKDKLMYSLLYHCPSAYRLLRILMDPTMLDWERAEKKRQREKRTTG